MRLVSNTDVYDHFVGADKMVGLKGNKNMNNIVRINNIDYISLTDLAKYKNSNDLGDVIIKFMSNKSISDFYCL